MSVKNKSYLYFYKSIIGAFIHIFPIKEDCILKNRDDKNPKNKYIKINILTPIVVISQFP